MEATEVATEVAVEKFYQVIPFNPTFERAPIVSMLMRGLCAFETMFSDYTRACEAKCFECDECTVAMQVVATTLSHPNSRVWEVWEFGGEDEGRLCGVLAATDVQPGVDANLHFCFFDGKLKDKTQLIEEWLEWMFEDHEDWKGVRRLTTQIPDHAIVLARYASKHHGFGGNFSYQARRESFPVEGVKRAAIRWRGVDRDILLMGRLR